MCVRRRIVHAVKEAGVDIHLDEETRCQFMQSSFASMYTSLPMYEQ